MNVVVIIRAILRKITYLPNCACRLRTRCILGHALITYHKFVYADILFILFVFYVTMVPRELTRNTKTSNYLKRNIISTKKQYEIVKWQIILNFAALPENMKMRLVQEQHWTYKSVIFTNKLQIIIDDDQDLAKL